MNTHAEFWDKLADDYAQKPVEDPDAFERKIAITKNHMNSTDVVLDIGCGTGSLALRLASAGGHVHGLDVSREMIRIANGKATGNKVDNVSFHNGRFDETFDKFPDGSLDGICAYSLLHLLVDDREAALARVYRLLKPGGFFISSTVCLGNSWIPFRPILTVMRWLGKAPPVAIVTKAGIVEEIKAAGFADVREVDVGAKAMIGFVVCRKPVA